MFGEKTEFLFVRNWVSGPTTSVPLVKSGHLEGTDDVDRFIPAGYFEDYEIRRRWEDLRAADVLRKSYGRVWPPSLAAGRIVPAQA